MRKRMILTALAAVAIPTLLMAADEARLMRFPATNGSEIVFSYAGDLYKVPATGGEAQRLTSYVGYEMFPRFSPMVRRSLLRDSTTVTRKCTRCPLPAVSHCVSLTRLRIAVMIWAIAWARTIS